MSINSAVGDRPIKTTFEPVRPDPTPPLSYYTSKRPGLSSKTACIGASQPVKKVALRLVRAAKMLFNDVQFVGRTKSDGPEIVLR